MYSPHYFDAEADSVRVAQALLSYHV
jgi:hypothetical protein